MIKTKKERNANNIRFSNKSPVVIGSKIFDEIVKIMVAPKYNVSLQHKFEGQRFTPDAYIEDLRLAFEYDGNVHYDDQFKIVGDHRKLDFYKRSNIWSIHYPYNLNPTKDVMKHIFGTLTEEAVGINFYSDEKYDKILKLFFKVDDESKVLACGMHKNPFIPSTWMVKGVDRFVNEIYTYPESVQSQVRHSLNLWLKDVEFEGDKREWLVLPNFTHEAFNEYMKKETNQEHLNHVFLRQNNEAK